MRITPRNWPATTGVRAAGARRAAGHSSHRLRDQATQVRVSTSMGDFVIEVMPDRAALTVAILPALREGGYYRAPSSMGGGQFSSFRVAATRQRPEAQAVHDPVNNESGSGLQNSGARSPGPR